MTQTIRAPMPRAQKQAASEPQPLGGLALLLIEMQELAQLIPGFGAKTPTDPAQTDNSAD